MSVGEISELCERSERRPRSVLVPTMDCEAREAERASVVGPGRSSRGYEMTLTGSPAIQASMSWTASVK
jgi:hypothetical protein